MTDKERIDSRKATLYDLRLIFTQRSEEDGKETYTLKEICELIDKMAMNAE